VHWGLEKILRHLWVPVARRPITSGARWLRPYSNTEPGSFGLCDELVHKVSANRICRQVE
jgi:hypothetical protein